MKNTHQIGIVDIFAGPGGLSEGFAGVGTPESRPFKIALSIEKDAAAHRTLRLRSAVHEMNQVEYQRYIDLLNEHVTVDEALMKANFPELWKRTSGVAHLHELSDVNQERTEELLESARANFSTIGLIGGPPCQVYSLAGRARNIGNHMYEGDNDHRHTLYKQYIHVLEYLKPAFFVMENVKGMLSSEHQSKKIFPLVREDLESAGSGYTLFALSATSAQQIDLSGTCTPFDHRDFIVRAERYGVPQKRHRIIIVGIRNDIAERDSLMGERLRLDENPEATVRGIISDLPRLRSGLSKEADSAPAWSERISEAYQTVLELKLDDEIRSILTAAFTAGESEWPNLDRKEVSAIQSDSPEAPAALRFITVDGLETVASHETRAHIRGDLARYIFASAFSGVFGRSPKASEFPLRLAPNHKNWTSGKFADRFRVQSWDTPSTTITSHISKDGHYYIHPDPVQARSLTVREAARLQTFPDDYIFLGNRTEQYHQVGNAVPPFLARQIATLVLGLTTL